MPRNNYVQEHQLSFSGIEEIGKTKALPSKKTASQISLVTLSKEELELLLQRVNKELERRK